VGDLKTQFSSIDRISRQKSAHILELSSTIDEMDIKDIYREFHPTTANCTFFSAVYGAFSKIDHNLGHKANLNKYKKNLK
jgi:hypothetical protein